ncbi:uncharacterized mitochondrial protein AtMg00810-like [Miscanthus floridulus]|uniref:uncharacterized mitochondrial protein AtMg00810-like n=1 Tax=Miscanthus floridulus TaxID=154761 RepID=UPI00345840C0
MYVDDLIVTGARAEDIDRFKCEMAARFRMSDLSALMLGQSAYASKLLEWSGMAKCKPYVTLMEERLKLTKASTTVKVDATLYWSFVGGLRYLVHMRSDIVFAVGYVSHFMEDPREDHWVAMKRLLRYVKGTVDQGIVFPKTDGSRLQLTVFNDVDMAGTLMDGGAPLACSFSSSQLQFYACR